MKVILLWCAFLLSSFVLAAEPVLSPFERQEIEKLKLQLVDPESLNLRNIQTVELENGASIVCGEMNAKNRSGGYNGFQRFFVAGQIVRLASVEPETFAGVWEMICEK